MFKKVYKVVKAPHVKKDIEDNDEDWDWTHEVYKQEYAFWIPLGWIFKDKFEGLEDAEDYIKYQLHPTYFYE